jgi:hypothetical protein
MKKAKQINTPLARLATSLSWTTCTELLANHPRRGEIAAVLFPCPFGEHPDPLSSLIREPIDGYKHLPDTEHPLALCA